LIFPGCFSNTARCLQDEVDARIEPDMTTDRERDYLTPGEVAQALHVSPKTIIRWANEGLIPCMMTLGGHRRFRRADVEDVVTRVESGVRSSAKG